MAFWRQESPANAAVAAASACVPRVPAYAKPPLLEWDSVAPHFLLLSASLHCHRLASAELCPLEGSTLLLGKSKSRSGISHCIVSVGIQDRGRVRGEPVGGKGGEVGRCEGGGGGRRADGLDLTGSHVLFYLTSRAHLQSIHLVIPGRCQDLW